MTGNIVSFDIGSAQIKLVWCAGGVCKAAVTAPVPDGLVRRRRPYSRLRRTSPA